MLFIFTYKNDTILLFPQLIRICNAPILSRYGKLLSWNTLKPICWTLLKATYLFKFKHAITNYAQTAYPLDSVYGWCSIVAAQPANSKSWSEWPLGGLLTFYTIELIAHHLLGNKRCHPGVAPVLLNTRESHWAPLCLKFTSMFSSLKDTTQKYHIKLLV